jgi:hypothetical protein
MFLLIAHCERRPAIGNTRHVSESLRRVIEHVNFHNVIIQAFVSYICNIIQYFKIFLNLSNASTRSLTFLLRFYVKSSHGETDYKLVESLFIFIFSIWLLYFTGIQSMKVPFDIISIIF